ncbi:MAG: YcxB family protein, partial [Caulobacter sp.]
MMEAAGRIVVGESTLAMAYVKARRGLSPRQAKFILLISMLAVGVPLAAWWSGSWFTALVSVEFAMLG